MVISYKVPGMCWATSDRAIEYEPMMAYYEYHPDTPGYDEYRKAMASSGDDYRKVIGGFGVCQYCGNPSGITDKRGGCVSCGAQVNR